MIEPLNKYMEFPGVEYLKKAAENLGMEYAKWKEKTILDNIAFTDREKILNILDTSKGKILLPIYSQLKEILDQYDIAEIESDDPYSLRLRVGRTIHTFKINIEA